MAVPPDHVPQFELITVEDYGPLVGAEIIERILRKASRLRDLHVAHVNDHCGGGVAELLSSLTTSSICRSFA
jgi:trehalose synthase